MLFVCGCDCIALCENAKYSIFKIIKNCKIQKIAINPDLDSNISYMYIRGNTDVCAADLNL